jgi:hypothetical protein
MPKKSATPKPVPTSVVCSLCGEPWAYHQADKGGEVSTLECIRLLKAKVVYHPVPYVQPVPYPVQPWQPWRTYPYWGLGNINTITCSDTTGTQTVNTATSPKVLMASAASSA